MDTSSLSELFEEIQEPLSLPYLYLNKVKKAIESNRIPVIVIGDSDITLNGTWGGLKAMKKDIELIDAINISYFPKERIRKEFVSIMELTCALQAVAVIVMEEDKMDSYCSSLKGLNARIIGMPFDYKQCKKLAKQEYSEVYSMDPQLGIAYVVAALVCAHPDDTFRRFSVMYEDCSRDMEIITDKVNYLINKWTGNTELFGSTRIEFKIPD